MLPIVKMSGQDFQTLKRRAASHDFKPVPLGVTASMTLKNTLRRINSHAQNRSNGERNQNPA